MSTDVLQNTNRLLSDAQPILDLLEAVDLPTLRDTTDVDWPNSRLIRCHPQLLQILLSKELVHPSPQDALVFEGRGRAFLGKLLLDIEGQLDRTAMVADRYTISNRLASGKNSIAYRAHDTKLGRETVLKFFRPGRGEGIIAAIPQLGPIHGDQVLVTPLDILLHPIHDYHGHPVPLNVLLFPYVAGVTLRQYLQDQRNCSPLVILAFIEQTCTAMRLLHSAGLTHGDLHPNNVLVTTDTDGRAAFRIIDISHGADIPSDYECPASDLEGFRHILGLALEDIQRHLPHISLRRHLGARLFILVEHILTTPHLTFDQIHHEIQKADRFADFTRRRQAFVDSKFRAPNNFGLLRFEELRDPDIALRLFCPYPTLFQRLSEFGSTALFGHRGTGKSTYLAAMNFFPEATANVPEANPRDSFGILFSCRQGEFRKFSAKALEDPAAVKLMKDILIAKIIRKTLSSISAGVARRRLAEPRTIAPIAEVLRPRVQRGQGIMLSHQLSELDSLTALMMHAEATAIDAFFGEEIPYLESEVLDEQTLLAFFEAIRASCNDLSQSRFAVLFDDAGRPNVPPIAQAAICDLMASTNTIYCVKISAEKRTFEFLTSYGKAIERVHDVRVYTISDYFNLGGGFATEAKGVEDYFRSLVNRRLEVCGFKTNDIIAYLGEPRMKPAEIVRRLANHGLGDPEYSGWHVVWKIADRTMRHLLEMINAIFEESRTLPTTEPALIPRGLQSRQILRFSKEKLRSLMFIPGTISIRGRPRPLGKTLYHFAASYGKVASEYLRKSGPRPRNDARGSKLDERLAIEIDDTLALGPDGQRMLDCLIRFAILDDEKFVTARDDRTRKPIYAFNKVYCPGLRMSFRRHTHWRLSSQRFERFLLDPTEFLRHDDAIDKAFRADQTEFDF